MAQIARRRFAERQKHSESRPSGDGDFDPLLILSTSAHCEAASLCDHHNGPSSGFGCYGSFQEYRPRWSRRLSPTICRIESISAAAAAVSPALHASLARRRQSSISSMVPRKGATRHAMNRRKAHSTESVPVGREPIGFDASLNQLRSVRTNSSGSPGSEHNR